MRNRTPQTGIPKRTDTVGKKPSIPPVIQIARNKPAFDADCLTQLKNVVPGTKLVEEPVYPDDGEPAERPEPAEWEAQKDVIRRLLHTLLDDSPSTEKAGQRLYAIAYSIGFESAPGSVRKLAERFKSSPSTAQQICTEVREKMPELSRDSKAK
jgi:hypothetical protein